MRNFACISLLFVFAVASGDVNAAVEDEIVEININAEIADADNFTFGSTNQYTTVVTRNGYIYVCWNDGDYRPFLTKIDEQTGSSQTFPLDHNEEDLYRAYPDGHHQFSMGIDKDGYIHILGDMHHGGNPFYRQESEEYPLPERFSGAEPYGWQLYWVSQQPEDISAFEFVGDDADRVFPGWQFTYYHFANDVNGELYMMARCSMREPRAHEPGTMGLGLYRYDLQQRQWTALGEVPPVDDPAYTHKGVVWEPHGHWNEEGTPWYQSYFSNMKFDRNNRLHITTPLNADSSYDDATHIVYAYSDDGGETFYRPNGEQIASLPMRVADGPNQAGIAMSKDETGGFNDHFTGLFWDNEYNPAVVYQVKDPDAMADPSRQSYYRYYNPVSGLWNTAVYPISMTYIRNDHHTGPDGVITFVGSHQIYRTEGFEQTGKSYNPDFTQPPGAGGGLIRQVDKTYLREKNILRGITQKDGKVVVVTIKFNDPADEILKGDINADSEVNLSDLLAFSNNWLRGDCIYGNTFCEGADITKSGDVSFVDFGAIASDWLTTYNARILFDFGSSSNTTPGGWNNITGYTTSFSLNGVVDENEQDTSVNYDCETSFSTINTGGMSSTVYPSSAGSDSFVVTSMSSKIRFSGLIPYSQYSLKFFGSKNDFSSKKLKVTIGEQSQTLETRRNTSNTVEITAEANSSGEILVELAADGTSYGYLGVVEINGIVMIQ